MTALKRLAQSTPVLKQLGRLRNTLLGRDMRSALKLDDRAFLQLFDVPKVNDALALGDNIAAGDALLEYYRTRYTPAWPPFPGHVTNIAELADSELLEQAERLLEHRFVLAAEPEVRFGERIDWQYDPTPDPRRRWARELHRHRWVAVLGEAYRRGGDERYASKFAQLMHDWIEYNPPPARKNEGHIVWTLMGVGMRCSIWPAAFAVFYNSPAFNRTGKLRMLRSICDHARFLFLFKTHANHLLRESNGLAMIAAAFPEFKEAVRWRDRALLRLAQELAAQINSDGSHIEMSTGYQWMVAEEFEAALDILQRANWGLPFGDLHETLQRIYVVLMLTSRPDGSWPQLSDGFMREPAQLRRQLAIAAAKLGREDFLFVAATGRDGTEPKQSSTLLPYGGLAIMRSDWSINARFLLMDCGPFGGFHGHEDKLSVEIYAYGQPFVVDPGTYTYNGTDPMRTHLVSSKAHNTVLVDGLSQVRRWQEQHGKPKAGVRENVAWMSTAEFDFVQSEYTDGYGAYSFAAPENAHILRSVSHRRSVLFVKPDYWLIVDDMQTDQPHQYQRLFQAAANIDISLQQSGACLRASNSGATLQLINPEFEPVELHCAAGSENPVAGWVSNGLRNHKQPAQQLAMRSAAKGAVSLVTLAYPAAGGAVPPVSLRRISLADDIGTAVCVTTPSGEDWLLINSCHGEKRCGDFTTMASIAGFRKKSDGETSTLFERQQPEGWMEAPA